MKDFYYDCIAKTDNSKDRNYIQDTMLLGEFIRYSKIVPVRQQDGSIVYKQYNKLQDGDRVIDQSFETTH